MDSDCRPGINRADEDFLLKYKGGRGGGNGASFGISWIDKGKIYFSSDYRYNGILIKLTFFSPWEEKVGKDCFSCWQLRIETGGEEEDRLKKAEGQRK